MSTSPSGNEGVRRKVADLVLRPFLDVRERGQVVEDLEELYTRRRSAGGSTAGMRWCLDLVRFPIALILQRPRGRDGGAGWSGGPLYDARHALKRLLRNPAYTVAVLATLMVTIGAATAVFSALNGVLLKPLPHPDADRLVRAYEVDARGSQVLEENPVAVANYRDWAAMNTTLSSMAALNLFESTFEIDGVPERVPFALVTPEFFSLVGVAPSLGRGFRPEEFEPGSDDVVILSDEYWRRRFNGDPTALGRVIQAGSSQLTVVGVLPPGFRFLERDVGIWVPLALSESELANRRSHYLTVIGRLKPGVTIERAQADLDRVVDTLRPQNPEYLDGWGVNVVRLVDDIVGTARPALLLLFAAVGFVVILGGVNVAALTLTRALDTVHETDVRRAIGATRGRLLRERLLEGLLLALFGAVAGIGVALLATRGLVAVAPPSLPRADAIGVDPAVFGFALIVSVLTVLTGTIGTVRGDGRDLSGSLRSAGRTTSTRSRRRWQSLFLGSQIALSLTLLVSAGLMLRSLGRLMDVDPGFDADRTITLKVNLPGSRYAAAPDQAPVLDALLDSTLSMPSVTAAGITNYLPLTDIESTWSIQIVGQPERRPDEKRDYGKHLISPGYFEAMGIPIVQGRGIRDTDRAGQPLVAVVNETLARRFFGPDEDPIGRRMYVISQPDEVFEIVGVVGDVHHESLDAEPVGAYYLAYRQVSADHWIGSSRLVARVEATAGSVVRAVRTAAGSIDPGILIYDERTMADRVRASSTVARTRFVSMLLVGFAAVALALTAIGVGGAVTQWTRQRHREIGIRLTMGATPASVVGRLVGDSGRIVAGGLLVGLAGAMAFARIESALLFGVAPLDPVTYVSAALMVAGGALFATLLPAARAGRTDPVTVLRSDR